MQRTASALCECWSCTGVLVNALNQLGDDLLFVMRADDQGKSTLFRKLFRLFHLTEQTEPGNHEIVNCKEYDDQLERDHHHIIIKVHFSSVLLLYK